MPRNGWLASHIIFLLHHQSKPPSIRPIRLSGTVYCHKAGLAALAVLRHRWMVAGWTLGSGEQANGKPM